MQNFIQNWYMSLGLHVSMASLDESEESNRIQPSQCVESIEVGHCNNATLLHKNIAFAYSVIIIPICCRCQHITPQRDRLKDTDLDQAWVSSRSYRYEATWLQHHVSIKANPAYMCAHDIAQTLENKLLYIIAFVGLLGGLIELTWTPLSSKKLTWAHLKSNRTRPHLNLFASST